MKTKITFDGTEERARQIIRTIQQRAPDFCDDQAPSYLTQENFPGQAFDLRVWLADGGASVAVGETVVVGDNSVELGG